MSEIMPSSNADGDGDSCRGSSASGKWEQQLRVERGKSIIIIKIIMMMM